MSVSSLSHTQARMHLRASAHTLHQSDSTNTGSVCYYGEQTGDKSRNSNVQPRMHIHFQMKISFHICSQALKPSCILNKGDLISPS